MMIEICSACGEEADEDHFEVVDTDKGPRRKCPVENKWAKLVDKGEGGETPLEIGTPDKYSMRLKAKARRFEGWIKSEPVGVSDSGGKKASDLIRQVMEAPSVLDNYDHLRMWIKEYFPQIKEPALNSFVEQLRMIDREYKGGPESRGGDYSQEADLETVVEEAATKAALASKRDPAAKARDEVIVSIGRETADTIGTLKEFVRTLFLEEAKENPEYRREILNRFPKVITLLRKMGGARKMEEAKSPADRRTDEALEKTLEEKEKPPDVQEKLKKGRRGARAEEEKPEERIDPGEILEGKND